MKNVLLIGCGGVADRWYLKGISKAKFCRIVAVVDMDLEKAKNTSLLYDIPYYYSDYQEAINELKIKVDIALVLTPHQTHFEIIQWCLNNGLNVYSEKPFAESYVQARRLIDIANKKNLCLCSAPQIMMSTRNQITKELVTRREIGDILLVRASGSNMGPADREGFAYDPRWFYQDGGSMSSLGIYTLSIIVYIWGLPKRVCGISTISYPKRTVKQGVYKNVDFEVTAPDNEIALLDYGNGMLVMIDGSYCVKDPVPYELTIHGTEGTIFVEGYGGIDSVMVKRGEKQIKAGPTDDFHLTWNLAWAVDQMAESLENPDIKPVANAVFASEVIYVMDAIRESSKSGKYFVIKS